MEIPIYGETEMEHIWIENRKYDVAIEIATKGLDNSKGKDIDFR